MQSKQWMCLKTNRILGKYLASIKTIKALIKPVTPSKKVTILLLVVLWGFRDTKRKRHFTPWNVSERK